MNKKLFFLTLIVACICTQFFHTTKSEDTASTTAPVEDTETGISMGNGFFGTITNELSSSYYASTSGLPITGNGAITKIGPSISAESGLGSATWGNYKFSELWDTNKTITLAPKDTTLAPTITFTFDDVAKTITIVVSYDTSINYTYYVNLIPIQNILNNETIVPEPYLPITVPLPTDWQLDITITSELEIIVNQIVIFSTIQLYDFTPLYKKVTVKKKDKKSTSSTKLVGSDKVETFKQSYPAPLNTIFTFTQDSTSKAVTVVVPVIPKEKSGDTTKEFSFHLPVSLATLWMNTLNVPKGAPFMDPPPGADLTSLQSSSMGGLCGQEVILSDQTTNPTCDN